MSTLLLPLSSPTLVGRAEERAALAEVSDGGFVLVAGEPGVGKSRLVREVAHGDARLLTGHCRGPDFPYAPLVEALGSLPEGTSRPHVFEALRSRLGRVVLVVEDLHWADPSTLDFLVFLAQSESRSLIATYRSDELHRRHPLRPVLAELERAAGVRRIALEPFSRDEAADQAAAVLGAAPDDELIRRLYARSQGNPLCIEELLAAWSGGAGRLPATLRDAVVERFARLPSAAREVVRVAAVAERPVGHARLQAVVGERVDGAQEAVAHRILVARSDATYAFRHALVREAIYEDLLPGERTALHAALAPTFDSPAERAHHWRGAQDLPRALEASVAAGLQAQRLFAHREALRQFERALALWERVPDARALAGMSRRDVLRAAAAAAGDGSEPARSIALWHEAITDRGDDGRSLELEAWRRRRRLTRSGARS